MQDDPWRILGIAPTTDAAAIYEAYNRKVAKLKLHDTADRYSQLMHARTQALAHVYRRPEAESRSAKPPQPEAEVDAPRVILRTADDPHAGEALAPNVYSEWPEDQPAPLPVSETAQTAPTDWFAALDRVKLGFGVVAFAGFLILTGVNWVSDRFGDEAQTYSEQWDPWEPYEPIAPGPLRDRAEAVMAELFGPQFDWEQAAQDDVGTVRYVLRDLEKSEDDVAEQDVLERTRSNLRVSMMFSRDRASREDLIAINRVYLGWLKTAQTQPGDACREVTGRAFFDGVPQMDEPALVAERALAGRLLREGSLDFDEGLIKPPEIPASILAEASRRSGMTENEITLAMEQITQPRHCEATIALLETVLEEPEAAPLQLLVRL